MAAKPLTKFAHRVTHAEDIPRLVSLAVRNATAAPQGMWAHQTKKKREREKFEARKR